MKSKGENGKPKMRRDESSVALRLIQTHLQVIVMLGSFDLAWPEFVLSMFKIFDVVSNLTGFHGAFNFAPKPM